jgi:two-component system, response regulator PdtaR
MSSIAVLVVEDDALIRLTIVDYLLGLGLNPVEADTADAAIAILEARGDIRLVFTDVQMPGTMDGIQLARYVRKRWPPTAIVICSATNQADADDLPTNCYWLAKPVDVHSIQIAINTAKQWLND